MARGRTFLAGGTSNAQFINVSDYSTLDSLLNIFDVESSSEKIYIESEYMGTQEKTCAIKTLLGAIPANYAFIAGERVFAFRRRVVVKIYGFNSLGANAYIGYAFRSDAGAKWTGWKAV